MARKSLVRAKAQENYYSNIIKGDIPCEFLHQDEQCVAFEELNPQAPVHFLVVPRNLASNLDSSSIQDAKLLGHLLTVAENMAIDRGLHKGGYHVMYTEDYQQDKSRPVAIHVFGRALHHMVWPML